MPRQDARPTPTSSTPIGSTILASVHVLTQARSDRRLRALEQSEGFRTRYDERKDPDRPGNNMHKPPTALPKPMPDHADGRLQSAAT